MAIVLQLGGRWFGLEADTKPTLGTNQAGAEFFETDTQTKFIWTGTKWSKRV